MTGPARASGAHGGRGAAGGAYSGGVPWAGRTLTPSPFAGDDGGADPRVAAALGARAAALAAGAPADEGLADVVAALAGTRVFVPGVAVAGATEESSLTGLTTDAGADMAVVSLEAPDGRRAMPVFTSAAALAAWRGAARPVPSEVERAALSATAEGCPLLLLDPGSDGSALLPRPAVEALAQRLPWQPSWRREDVAEVARAAAADEPSVRGVRVERGRRAETAVVLGLAPGLDRAALDALLGRVQQRLAAEPLVATAVDSLELRVVAA